MSQEKKDLVEEMGFGALANVPEMNVSNILLKELLDRFDEEKVCLKILQEKIYITPQKVTATLGITNGGNRFPNKVDYNNLNPADKEIFDSIKNIFLVTLTRNVLDMSVEGEENWKIFKRTFVIFIQKLFLLPTAVSVASPIHKPPIFHVDNIREWDWVKHVLNFLMKGVENKRKGRKQSVDDCVFVLMLIYFHETKFSRPFALDAPPAPWVAHWTKQMMLERISNDATEPLKTEMDEDPNKKDKGKRLASEAEPSPEKDPKKPRPLMESSSIADNFQQVNEAEAAAESFAETTITYVVMDDPEEPEVESHERFQTRGSSSSKKQGDDDKDNKDNKGNDK
ncbi:uncharacterized protein DS421_5g139470 [Arachis hypogaea]|nr:uncharacterized protein DS421_5g139470 [Arachis hypogaea]